MVGAIILFGPIFVTVVSAMVAGFGLAMALPVGLLCAWLAHRKGLSARRYGAAGGAYTVLFFLPGAYFALRLLGRQVNPYLVRAAYVLLYGFWALGHLGMVAILLMIGAIQGFVVVMVMIAFFLLILFSGRQLLDTIETDSADGEPRAHAEAEPQQILFLGRVYVMPFAGAFISLILIALFFTDVSPLSRLIENTTPPWQR